MTPNLLKLHQTRNPMAAYAELPVGVSYLDQQPDESVQILLRRHVVTNTGWLLASIIGIFVPPLLGHLNPGQYEGLGILTRIPLSTLSLVTLLWYTVVAGYALQNFLNWYYNVYLVTSERLVDVDFTGLLRYSSTETALHQIQDVKHKQGGLWQMLFNYGQVEAQTAGTKQNIIFEKVPRPARVADIVTDLLPRVGDEAEPENMSASTPTTPAIPQEPTP